MKVLLNYANQSYQALQQRNSSTGREVAGFDQVLSYGPTDIDRPFLARNEKILSQIRGNGYWLWKPYFIEKTLRTLDEGDILFYCDAGSHFIGSIQPLIDAYLRAEQAVMTFELPLIEKVWTKRDAFLRLNCDRPEFANSPQRLASFSLWRKSPLALSFAQEWLALAQDEALLTDLPNPSGAANYEGFKEHRHDQSLFSLLAKKHGLPAWRDPSQYGNRVRRKYPQSNYRQIIAHTRNRVTPPVWACVKREFSRLGAQLGKWGAALIDRGQERQAELVRHS